MQLLRPPGVLLFFAVLIAHCFCIYYGVQPARFTTKLLLAPLLIAMLFFSGRPVPALVYAGLASCFFGDLLLAQQGDGFFVPGMLAFILAHTCNSIYFYRLQHRHTCRMREAVAVAIILILLSATVLTLLNSYLGSLRIPILVYMVIISIMAILAASTTGNNAVKAIAIGRFIPGAGLFVFSDALLAINKFMVHDARLDIPVMLAYGAALFFLTEGFLMVTYTAENHALSADTGHPSPKN